jgi:hypothetical protein
MLKCYLVRYDAPLLATSSYATQFKAATASDFLAASCAAPEPLGQYLMDGSQPPVTAVITS